MPRVLISDEKSAPERGGHTAASQQSEPTGRRITTTHARGQWWEGQ